MATPLAAALGFAAGCVESTEPLGQISSASTVADYVGSTGCSTAVVLGLARQISDQIACSNPGTLVPFESGATLIFTSSAVLPYLEADAKADLLAVASTGGLQINSAFRTVAQQYLLYQWYEAGRCGITAAATVGSSNHETGRAIDLEDAGAEVVAMAGDSWSHDVAGDEPHFDHNPSEDLRGQDTRGFQHLWNRNHPDDLIGEDGLYGAQTEARLQQAPATGFDLGPDCGDGPPSTTAAEARAIDGPDSAPPLTRAHFSITLANIGTAPIPATTQLVIASGPSSPLHDPSWLSATAITTVGSEIASGALGTVEFDVTTPNAAVATPVAQRLALLDGTTQFGSINIAVTVTPGMSTPTSGDGSEPPTMWTPPTETGGCSTTGTSGSSGCVLLAFVLVAWGRRRRRVRDAGGSDHRIVTTTARRSRS